MSITSFGFKISQILRKFMEKIGFFVPDDIFYIGSADTLPPPLTAEEEIAQTDRADGRYPRDDQIDGNEQHAAHGHKAQNQKDALDGLFKQIILFLHNKIF